MSKDKKRSSSEKPSKPVDPVDAFCHAYFCAKSGWILQEHAGLHGDGTTVFPSAILSAFALEVYIKCVHYDLGIRPDDIHSIQKLFNSLPDQEKKSIEELFDVIVALSPAPQLAKTLPQYKGIDLGLKATLSRCDKLFFRIRYDYEWMGNDGKNWEPWGTEGLTSLLNAINSYLIERHPDWPERLERRKADFKMVKVGRSRMPHT